MRHLLLFGSLILLMGFAAVRSAEAQSNDARESTSSGESTQTSEEEDPHFPVLTLGGAGGLFARNTSAGGFVNGNFDFSSDWAFAGLSVTAGALGNSPNDWLFSEASGYAHLLAIGLSDMTYRRYIDGDELRFFGGFSYTRSHEDIVRVDVNLGVDYFKERQHAIRVNEWGLQIGARIKAKFWQIENFLQFSIYQNLEIGTGSVDLGGTQIVCNNISDVLAGANLMCMIPERDPTMMPTASSGSGLVTWQTTGFLVLERMFLNLYQDGEGGRLGPEIELRCEKLPLRNINFWAMVSFRYYWSIDGI